MSRHDGEKRRRRALSFLLATGLAITGISGMLALGASPAAAAPGACPPGTIPAPGPGNEVWSDNNVAVYAGADILVDGQAAELEGLVIAAGDATFARPGGRVNVGTVGVGSQVRPTSGTTMLISGGALTVAASTILDVGANAFDPTGSTLLGGNIQVGGAASPVFPAPQYELNNGSLHSGLGAPDALGDFVDWGTEISDTSQQLAAETSPGTATSVLGNQVTFTGTGVAGALQVFSLTAAQANAVNEIYFVGIADDAPVVINVTGAAPITLLHTYYAENGVRADDLSSPLFGMVASRTLWNFTDASAVSVAGTSQVLGSLLAPNGSFDITASTNGRVYAGADIHVHGEGNELHNYPWIAPPFECIPDPPPATGGVSLQKLLGPGAGSVPPQSLPVFSGTVQCAVPLRFGALVEEWELSPPEVLQISGLPVGSVCTIAENPPSAPRGAQWLEPEWTVDGVPTAAPVTFTVPDPSSAVQVTLAVTNDIAVGSFTIAKVVNGANAPRSTFAGTWACTLDGAPAGSGSWNLSEGESSAPIAAPVGALCRVAEDAPPSATGGWWHEPAITPAEFAIADAAASVRIEVVNTFDPTLAPTGAGGLENAARIAVTAVVLGAGLVLWGARRKPGADPSASTSSVRRQVAEASDIT